MGTQLNRSHTQSDPAEGLAGEWQSVSLRQSGQWSFVGGDWTQDNDGLITPSSRPGTDLLAIAADKTYTDLEAEFDFRWNVGHCGAGMIVRAQDAGHYYLVHFPCCAQCNRAEHFWAAVSKVGDDGWVEVLDMQMVHGVASELDIWHTARVVVVGDEIHLWVDGRPLPVVKDDTYKSGSIGLESWTYSGPGSSFRNVRVRGVEAGGGAWRASVEPPQNWFNPYPQGDKQQSVSSITRAPNGELLMVLNPVGLLRSADNGRTWSEVESPTWSGAWVRTLRDGRLIGLGRSEDGQELFVSESPDNGRSWGEPVKAQMGPFTPPENAPQMKLGGYQDPIELDDGTLVAWQVSRIPGHGHESGFDIWEWGMYGGCSAWSVRSTDGGLTWSSPTPLNGEPAIGQKYDLVECSSNTQTKEGKVLSLVRPVHSPWIWEVWSDDRAQTWSPATSGPFPSYNCAMLPHATASGALLIGGRMPALGLYVSHDSGMSWKLYRIDTVIWAGGAMIEVEPDVVLWVYMGEYDPLPDARAQFLRVTAEGLEPARDMLP